VLGAEQKVSAEAALRAVTADAAWQNFEEATKGTLEPGKLADLVVLDRNPLAVEPAEIREARVVETVVGGQTIFKR
jgi:predicted amidohydrolase YtcJ